MLLQQFKLQYLVDRKLIFLWKYFVIYLPKILQIIIRLSLSIVDI